MSSSSDSLPGKPRSSTAAAAVHAVRVGGLENAGHDPQRFDGPIGVFAGATTNSYYLQNLLSRSDVTDPLGPMTVLMSNANDYIATRVSYKFDLQGPALNIQNVLDLAGGRLPRGAESADLPVRHGTGRCGVGPTPATAGDTSTRGSDPGAGRPLPRVRRRRGRHGVQQRARHRRAAPAARRPADGNTIYAVIKGAALNNDGSAKVGFTAPSVDGHAQVISMAQMLGGIDPATILHRSPRHRHRPGRSRSRA